MYLVIKTNKEETPVKRTTRGRPSTKVTTPPPPQEILAFATFDLMSKYILRVGLDNCKVFDATELNLKLEIENQAVEVEEV